MLCLSLLGSENLDNLSKEMIFVDVEFISLRLHIKVSSSSGQYLSVNRGTVDVTLRSTKRESI